LANQSLALTTSQNLLDDNLTDQQVSEPVDCHLGTVARTRKRYTEAGLAGITRRKADRIYERKLDPRKEAI